MDETIGKVSANYVTWPSDGKRVKRKINLIPCEELMRLKSVEQGKKEITENQRKFLKAAFDSAALRNSNTYLCPEDKLDSIQGRFEETEFDFIEIALTGCDIPEDDPLGRKCKSDEEITGIPINFIYQNVRIDLRPETDDKDKIYRFADFTNFMNINPLIRQNMNVFLAPTDVIQENPFDAIRINPDKSTI